MPSGPAVTNSRWQSSGSETVRASCTSSRTRWAREKSLELLAAGPTVRSAIFAAHDELALGVLQAIAELGLSAAQASP